MRDLAKESLLAQARQHGIPEAEAVAAWDEMVRVHGLPFYVEPEMETRPDGTVQLSPAVDINLLSRVEEEVPGWGRISGPVWPEQGSRKVKKWTIWHPTVSVLDPDQEKQARYERTIEKVRQVGGKVIEAGVAEVLEDKSIADMVSGVLFLGGFSPTRVIESEVWVGKEGEEGKGGP